MLIKRIVCLWSVAAFIAFMGFSGITFAGNLEPSASPAPTMKTLDEIPPTWSQKLPASERFELVLDDAAVLDKETGLVWEQSPVITGGINSDGRIIWTDAISRCYTKEVKNRKGWHLPTVEQLASLVDSRLSPSLPPGHPFSSSVQDSTYWTATTSASNNLSAWYVSFRNGGLIESDKGIAHLVWCVRGEQSFDAFGN